MSKKLARALCDLLARYRDPHLPSPTLYMQKFVCQNLVMGQSYGRCQIILPAITCLPFLKYGHILGKTPW